MGGSESRLLWHNLPTMRTALAALIAALPLTLVAASGTINHPTGTDGVFMVDKLGAHARWFDPLTLQERANLPLPTNPHDFVFSPDHTRAYVPIYGPGIYNRNPEPKHHLYVIDLTKRTVVSVIDLSPYTSPHGIQIAPDGSLYVTAELDRKIVHVDPVRGRVLDAIDVEGTAHWIAILLGAEGDGLTARALSAADTIVTIPMQHGVDSLNVASASAVALYALRVR